ncbi:MAG: hypothetical protein F4174_07180 [Acidobacteria bacterium]|nr:hypothetical protein [Acidobacteriota bacterium]
MRVSPGGGFQTDTATAAIAHLKAKYEDIWDRNPSKPQQQRDLALRTYRAVSWFERGDLARKSGDPDVAFILYWIALNAAYGRDVDDVTDSGSLQRYLFRLIELDTRRAISNAVWDRFFGPITRLLNNEYLYRPYWDNATGKPDKEDWREWFDRDNQRADSPGRTRTVLSVLFWRLYTLRNQLVHGSATWRSSLNRDSVEDGADIMEFLIPVFIETMLGNRNEDWGPPFYPPGLHEGRPPR